MDVIDAVITAEGERKMTTSTTSEQALQATPAGDLQEPNADTKATPAPRKPRVTPAKGQASKAATPAKKTPKAPKKAKSPKESEGEKAGGVREGSKTATVLALIQRAKGATLAEIMEATSWQPHSVRGFISGTLGKKMGLKVESAKREDGERVYSLSK
jgi:hypothetical protein